VSSEGMDYIMIDLLAAIGVLLVFGIIMLVIKQLSERLTAEWSRKIIHVVMGCVALTLPYIFENRHTVIFVGVAAIVMLLMLKKNKYLHLKLGAVLWGGSRNSLGEIYFVISIVAVFFVHEYVFAYLIAILILTFADSIAALLGEKYGSYNMAHHQEGTKSIEGSAMFFIVSFTCVLIPVLLMTEIGRAEVLAISLLVGFLSTMTEAVSTKGTDNLWLPILTYIFVVNNFQHPLNMLLYNLAILTTVFMIFVFVYKYTDISKLSVAYSTLVAYIAFTLGGILWVLPLIMFAISLAIFPMMKNEERIESKTYKFIETNTKIGVIILCVAIFLPQYASLLYIVFSLSFACFLAVNAVNRLINNSEMKKSVALVYGITKATIFIALPTMLIKQINLLVFILYLTFLIASILLAIYFEKHNERVKNFRISNLTTIVLLTFYTLIVIALEGYSQSL